MNDDPRTVALTLLERYARDPLCWQTLESPFSYWFWRPEPSREPEAFAGYVDTGRAWVVAGPPVGPPAELARLTRELVRAAKSCRRGVVFFGAPPDLIAATGGKALRMGLRPYWDPRGFHLDGAERASLRYQLRRAARHGVRVRQVAPEELAPGTRLGAEVDACARAWLDRRAMAPMGFAVSLELYVYPERHLYFVAECRDRVVGFLSAVPVFHPPGWFVEDLLRTDGAPNGTTEALVCALLAEAREQGKCYVTLGLVPLAGPLGLPLRLVRALTRPLFDFAGLAHFKDKLGPAGHEPRFLGGADGMGRLGAVVETLSAFSRVGLLRFGLDTLARGSLAAVAALTLLLVVWIPFLALASTRHWFPSGWVHAAWLGFDCLLAAGLVRLCRRYRHRLAVTLASAITLDAALTLFEALAFNWPRVASPPEGVIVMGACLGPIAGALALWSVVRGQKRRRGRG